MNTEPQYPLLIVDLKGWLGWCAREKKDRYSLLGALNTHRWVGFDAFGGKWQVSPDSFPYRDKWWTRVLANTIYNPRFESELRWMPAGQYNFEELQEQICSLIDHDDDILTQRMEPDRLKMIVRRSGSFDELTGKLRKLRVIG